MDLRTENESADLILTERDNRVQYKLKFTFLFLSLVRCCSRRKSQAEYDVHRDVLLIY
jgi:hypothetical protein